MIMIELYFKYLYIGPIIVCLVGFGFFLVARFISKIVEDLIKSIWRR